MNEPTKRRWLALALAFTAPAALACGSAGATAANDASAKSAARAPTSRANVLSLEDIRRSNQSNAYDVVSMLRPRWMQTRGTDSFQRPTQIQVYVDNSRLTGGLASLRDIPSLGITKIEWITPIEAAARWGLDHGQGAIVVTTATR